MQIHTTELSPLALFWYLSLQIILVLHNTPPATSSTALMNHHLVRHVPANLDITPLPVDLQVSPAVFFDKKIEEHDYSKKTQKMFTVLNTDISHQLVHLKPGLAGHYQLK